jgi:lysophospholipase L1-like esterase
MTQVFIFGASTAYGVGAESGGWGDLLKQSLHAKMYGEGGVGEKYEVYNFAQPGATIEFVLVTAIEQLKFYRRSGNVIAAVLVGGNNIKAENEPDNFVSSIEEYEQIMSQLIEKLKDSVDELIMLDVPPVDEAKTNPKPNPLTGGKSYFQNDRIILFNHALMKLCDKYGVHHIDLTVDPKEWAAKHLSVDGLHPNQAGYRYIFEQLSPEVEKLLHND